MLCNHSSLFSGLLAPNLWSSLLDVVNPLEEFRLNSGMNGADRIRLEHC